MATDRPPPSTASVIADADAPVLIFGEVDRFLFGPDERTGFAILRVLRDDGAAIVVAGPSGGARIGERVKVVGMWEDRPPYGMRLKASAVEPDDDSLTDDGLARSLAGLAPGLGTGRAARIVHAYGGARETVRILDAHEPGWTPPSVRGVPDSVMVGLATAWRERRAERVLEAGLASLGLAPGLRARIRALYGGDAVRVAREEPYRLAREVSGIGFLRADDLALASGSVLVDSGERIDAAVLHACSIEAEEHGHTLVPEVRFVPVLCGLFSTRTPPGPFAANPSSAIRSSLDRLVGRGFLCADSANGVSLPRLAEAEKKIADALAQSMSTDATSRRGEREKIRYPVPEGLSDEQMRAVDYALSRGLCIVTGGPGTGKTYSTRAIVEAAEHAELRVELCAPTARAAKRLSEATGRDAMTIHRLLEAKGDYAQENSIGAMRNRDNPLDADLVLVDECSMVGVILMAALLDAVPIGCRVVFVGDKDQLPPVDAGAPFRDAIESGSVPVAHLVQIHRQAEGSAVVRAAHEVLRGRAPRASVGGDRSDGCLHIVERGRPEDALQTLVEIVANVEDELGVDPRVDVLVLSPMRKGPLGADAINTALQARLNPPSDGAKETRPVGRGAKKGKNGNGSASDESEKHQTIFREGDKVRQTANDYNRGVLNGDVGRISVVHETGDLSRARGAVLEVDFGDDRPCVQYGKEHLGKLTLSYCSTVHAAQGGEAKVVVFAIADYHRIMLDRTLVYTALTRARKACLVVGSSKAMAIAAKTARADQRRTMLAAMLRARIASTVRS